MELQITVDAYFDAPFNVGTGALADSTVNRPTFKDGRDRPIIPGSAVKGRLRHTCERLLRALQHDNRACCQTPAPDATCPLDPAWLGDFCPICRLFGSPHRAGPLTFSDLHWVEFALVAPTDIRTGVSIRRNRRVAEPQRLYDVEVFGPGPQTHYRGQISGHVVEDDAQALAALLWGGLQMTETLGGGRSRGLGACRLETRLRQDRRPVRADWLREGLQTWTV